MKKSLRNSLLAIALLLLLAVGGSFVFRWCSTVAERDIEGLTRQAADYLGAPLTIRQTAQTGDYLAALCLRQDGRWALCVYDRDKWFPFRWRANGGKRWMTAGDCDSWNYGSPQGEAVLIFCGGDLPAEARWYTFQQEGTTYTYPVEGGQILDVFVFPDSDDLFASPTLLDGNRDPLP